MTQIVINKCHGGFGLSDKAVLRYMELAGRAVYPEATDSAIIGPTYWLVPAGPARYNDAVISAAWDTMTTEERQAANTLWDEQVFYPRDVARDDSLLVQTVRELGEEAGNWACVPTIVEIPDDVEWELEEYDGLEWIAEKHRTWG